MPTRDLRRLAKVLDWSVRRMRLKSSPARCIWRLTTDHITLNFESFEKVVSKVDANIAICWQISRAGKLLADILEDPLHPKHAYAADWYCRGDDWSEDEAWDLVTMPRYRVNEPAPISWTDRELRTLTVDLRWDGALLRAVGRERAKRSAMQLRALVGNEDGTLRLRPRL
jgi:hypothetical protein